MTKIKNTGAYPIKKYPIPSDFFIGSDSENNGETINFEIQKIINMASGLKDYIFSMSSLPIVSPQGDGYFQTNGIKNFALITTLSISKKTLAGQDLTPFMTWLGSNLTEFTLYIVSKTNQNIFADFAITSVTQQTDYFVFTVTFAPGDNYLGELIEKDIYTFNYEKTAAGSVLDLLTQTITDGDTHHAPSGDAVYDALILKAPLLSPGFTGIPTAPTAAPGTNTIQLANTSFVTAALTLLDATLLHKTGNEVKTGTLTVNSIIRAGGLATQFLKADGSIDSNTYLTAESDTLQSVTNRGAVTTTSLTALSFIKTGGLASQFLKANGSIDANVYALDSSVIHNTGNETKTGTLTVNSIIKAGGTASQFLKADGSSDATVYAVDSTVIHTTGNEVKTGSLTVNSIIRAGGLATQFLKADGSIDSNTYLTTESDTLQSVTARGATTTLGITALSFIKSGGTASQYLMADGSVTTAANIIIPATQVTATPHVDYLTGANVQLQLDNTETNVVGLYKIDKTDDKTLKQTGRYRPDTDVSVLSISPADTLNITACDNILFVNEIMPDIPANKVPDFLKSFGNKSFVVNGTNTPLAADTRGIFYVGLDKLGNQVYRTSKIYDQDVAYMARLLVNNTAGVYTIVSAKYFPDLANNRVNNRDRLVLSSGYIVPSGAASISFGNRGMTYSKNSINYSNNKLDPNYLTIADSVNPTPMSFLFFLPNITSLAVSIATSTVIDPTVWYTAGGAVGGGAVNPIHYQVYRLFITVTGTIAIQTKASTSNAPDPGVNAIFATREAALAGLTSTIFPDVLPAGDSIALGTFYLRAGTAVNGSTMTDPNDFYFRPFTATSSSSSVGVTVHDLLSGKNDNPTFQHVTTTDIANWNIAYTNRITSLTTTGTSGAATLISNVLNIPVYAPQSGSANYIQNQNASAQSANMWINGGGRFEGGIEGITTSARPFRFGVTTAAQNYGVFLQNNGTALAYMGDANGSAIGGGTVADFAISAPNGKLFLQAATNVVLNGFGTTNVLIGRPTEIGVHNHKLQIKGDRGLTINPLNGNPTGTINDNNIWIGEQSENSDYGLGISFIVDAGVYCPKLQGYHGGSGNKFLIQPEGGNVLIGTTSDNGTDKLQVAGKISTQEITSNLFNFRSDNFKTANASIGKFSTFTGGGQDFELIFNRSAAGAGGYYGIQSVEQAVGYRNIALNQNGGNVLIGTTSDNGTHKLQVNGRAIFGDAQTAFLNVFGAGGVNSATGAIYLNNGIDPKTWAIITGVPGAFQDGFSIKNMTDGNTALYIKNNGNVLINTLSDSGARLQLSGPLGGVVGNSGSAIRMTNTDTSNYVGISAGIVGQSNVGMEFSEDGISRMVLRGGNLGIGTGNPDSKVTIENNTATLKLRVATEPDAYWTTINTLYQANSFKLINRSAGSTRELLGRYGDNFISLMADVGGGRVAINTPTDNGVDTLQVNGRIKADRLNLAAEQFASNIITVPAGSQNWVKLFTTSSDNYLNAYIKGNLTSENSVQSFTIDIKGGYYDLNQGFPHQPFIEVTTETYNDRLIKVMVIKESSRHAVYVLVNSTDKNVDMFWNLDSNDRFDITIHNILTAPANDSGAFAVPFQHVKSNNRGLRLDNSGQFVVGVNVPPVGNYGRLNVNNGDIVVTEDVGSGISVGLIRGDNFNYGTGGAIRTVTSNNVADQRLDLGRVVSGTRIFNPLMSIMSNSGNVLINSTTDNGVDRLQVNGSIRAQGGLYTGAHSALGGATGNSYNTASLEVLGGGAADTIFPTIGFHQSGLYAHTLQGRSNGFHFMDIDGTSRVSIFTANIDASGTVTATGGFFNSDARLKDVVSRDGDVVKFKWKDGRDDKTHIGLIAQEVQEYMPDSVQEGADGMLSVNYIEVLLAKITAMEKRIVELENR